MFQGGRDVHPTELPRGFGERFDKEAANMGRVTLSFSDSWIDGICGFHQVPWHVSCNLPKGEMSGIPRFHFLLFPDMCTYVYVWKTSYLLGPCRFWSNECGDFHCHLRHFTFNIMIQPIARTSAMKLILKGKVTSQVTADIWENYSIYQMMPQVVGGCIWAAVGHERSQNATVCRSLGHS